MRTAVNPVGELVCPPRPLVEPLPLELLGRVLAGLERLAAR